MKLKEQFLLKKLKLTHEIHMLHNTELTTTNF
jgi:hypothetical protein